MTPPLLYVFDLDGTLYRGSEVVPYAVEVVQSLRKRGAQLRFLTNNSGSHPKNICSKLIGMGFEAELHEIYTSSMGAALWMQRSNLSRAFVVGETGLSEVLRDYGIEVVDRCPEAVIAGICRSLTYDWISDAMRFILDGAEFVATNTDSAYPIENGAFQPGAGATVAAIRACTQVEPVVIGKPEGYLLEKISEESQVDFQDMLVIGDRIDTDIEAGMRVGCQTFLVLTGTTTSVPKGQWCGRDLRGLLGKSVHSVS
jgi:4-nitrophenyl phosphatase